MDASITTNLALVTPRGQGALEVVALGLGAAIRKI
jgi:hypothetical protein